MSHHVYLDWTVFSFVYRRPPFRFSSLTLIGVLRCFALAPFFGGVRGSVPPVCMQHWSTVQLPTLSNHEDVTCHRSIHPPAHTHPHTETEVGTERIMVNKKQITSSYIRFYRSRKIKKKREKAVHTFSAMGDCKPCNPLFSARTTFCTHKTCTYTQTSLCL